MTYVFAELAKPTEQRAVDYEAKMKELILQFMESMTPTIKIAEASEEEAAADKVESDSSDSEGDNMADDAVGDGSEVAPQPGGDGNSATRKIRKRELKKARQAAKKLKKSE